MSGGISSALYAAVYQILPGTGILWITSTSDIRSREAALSRRACFNPRTWVGAIVEIPARLHASSSTCRKGASVTTDKSIESVTATALMKQSLGN